MHLDFRGFKSKPIPMSQSEDTLIVLFNQFKAESRSSSITNKDKSSAYIRVYMTFVLDLKVVLKTVEEIK